jgi:hypothetical protein
LAEHLEEQLGACLRQRHEAQLIDDEQFIAGDLLPAKNGTQNQGSTTSGPGTTALRWAGSCRPMMARIRISHHHRQCCRQPAGRGSERCRDSAVWHPAAPHRPQ